MNRMTLKNHHFLSNPYGYTYYRLNQMRLLKSAVGKAIIGLVGLQLGALAFLCIDVAWLLCPGWFALNYEALAIPAWVIGTVLIAAMALERVLGSSKSYLEKKSLFANESWAERRFGSALIIGFYSLSFICFVVLAVLPAWY